MVDYYLFNFSRAYLDHFHWIDWFYCTGSQTFRHTLRHTHFQKIVILWGKVGVIHAKIFEIILATLPLTLKLQINIYQGFPNRYCKFELVKAFQRYIFKVGNEKDLTTLFLQIWGFGKMKFCSKIDINLDSDVPQKPWTAHWKAFSVSISPYK